MSPSPTERSSPPRDPPITAAVDPSDPNGFRFSGAPGFYTIAVSHPHYQPLDEDADPAETPPPDLVSLGAYRMTNGTPNDITVPWTLDIEPGILDITALENTIAGTGVAGAAVGITGPNGFSANLVAGPDGRLVVDDLLPGSYRLTIRRLAAGEDEFFPVIVTVVVPPGADDAARTRVVRAPLPRIGGWLAGTVSAAEPRGQPRAPAGRHRQPHLHATQRADGVPGGCAARDDRQHGDRGRHQPAERGAHPVGRPSPPIPLVDRSATCSRTSPPAPIN